MKDYYLILGIEPNATTEIIKKAYKAQAVKFHPDKNQGDKYFEIRFQDILEAYETLIDHEKRKAYDYQVLKSYKQNVPTEGDYSNSSSTIDG